MLKKLGEKQELSQTTVTAAEAYYPVPFEAGLEFSPPARGVWNIVHTGMLVPEAHEIFVCAAGCLRGVVLTAAEMGASDRFSTVEIRENNVLDGDMEELIINGVSDILNKLPKLPRAALVYTSCIHHFMACDLKRCYRVLEKRFPQVDFTDCCMNPIMRKSGMTPDAIMRSRLYSLLKPRPINERAVNIVGSDLPTDPECGIVRMISDNGFTLREITSCRSYDEYQEMAEAALNIAVYPSAKAGGEELSRRLGSCFLYLPFSFDYNEIDRQLITLGKTLGITYTPDPSLRDKADSALESVKNIIKDIPIAVDYTAFTHPLQLTLLLLSRGFNVTDVFLDSVSAEDREAFDIIKEKYPTLRYHPTAHPGMRVFGSSEKCLAIGQKAAYFTGTDRFVNIVEDGGLHGYEGIIKLAGLMRDAYEIPKDARDYIQEKGLGCSGGCCL